MNFNRSNQHKNFTRSENQIGLEVENYRNSFSHCGRHENRQDNRIVASLTIFAFILLQSWRKSRKEIKQLRQSKQDLKQTNTRTETQLRVYGSLIRVEQRRTDDLTAQLKRTLDNLKRKTQCCKSFALTLSNLRSSQTLLEQELKRGYEEYHDLNEVLTQTKKQLFRSMIEQRNLNMQLCKEQRAVQVLENEKKILITEVKNFLLQQPGYAIRDLNSEHRDVEMNYLKQLSDKNAEIKEGKQLLRKCETALIGVQQKSAGCDKTQRCVTKTENELQLALWPIAGVQKSLLSSICQRLGMIWSRLAEYRKHTLNCFHLMAYNMLPATPLPRLKHQYHGN